jgi:hypothetical protein
MAKKKYPSEINSHVIRVNAGDHVAFKEFCEKAGITQAEGFHSLLTGRNKADLASSTPAAQIPMTALFDLQTRLDRLESSVSRPNTEGGITKVCTECDRKQSEIESLTEKVVDLQNEKARVIPSVQEFVAHCESGQCADHAKQWAEIQQQIVEANKPSIVRAVLENLPDTVVESEGLKRGFIPQRIIIPGKFVRGNP